GMIGVEMWGKMHAGEDPIACVADARQFVDCLVTEAWPAGQPCSPSSKTETNEKDSSERVISRPETEHYFSDR
ncbi:MAG TPA: hypothetical protein VK897_12400, partial [Anaerolineales bacterium]|nr:hypothetical protein [Anaerolineales bacterium]